MYEGAYMFDFLTAAEYPSGTEELPIYHKFLTSVFRQISGYVFSFLGFQKLWIKVGFIVTYGLSADQISSHLMLNGGLGKRTRKECHEEVVVLYFLHYDFCLCMYILHRELYRLEDAV